MKHRQHESSGESEAAELMHKNRIQIVFEDNHILVVHKPAGLSTQSDGRTEDLLSLCREYIRLKYQKPGRAFMGLVHRLDRPVEGIVVLARTSKAAARLSKQFQERTVRKLYAALVEGNVPEDQGVWVDTLAEQTVADSPGRRARQVDDGEDEPTGKEARLSFRTIERRGTTTMLEIELHTGRLHQIRFQCASRGHPIKGDAQYGSVEDGSAQSGHSLSRPAPIALAAIRLEFHHPVSGQSLEFQIPLPAAWGR